MSKSIGNIVDPIQLVNKYSLNAVRFYFLTNGPQNHDVNLEENMIEEIYYRNIPDVLINLILRVTNAKVMGSLESLNSMDEWSDEYKTKIDYNMDLVSETLRFLEKYDFMTASQKIHLILLELNNLVHSSKFWLRIEDKKFLSEVVCFTLEFIRITSILLKPFLPDLMINIHKFLGVDPNNMKIDCCFFRMKNSFQSGKLINDKLLKYNMDFNNVLKEHGYFKIDFGMKNVIFVTKS